MSPEEVTSARRRLALTQPELAGLLGVHALTVSKWERGKLAPDPYRAALVAAFGEVGPEVARRAVEALAGEGVAAALAVLLTGGHTDSRRGPPG